MGHSSTPPDATVIDSGPRLREDQKSTLVQAPSPKEIKVVLFAIVNDKALDPDRFSSKIFKTT